MTKGLTRRIAHLFGQPTFYSSWPWPHMVAVWAVRGCVLRRDQIHQRPVHLQISLFFSMFLSLSLFLSLCPPPLCVSHSLHPRYLYFSRISCRCFASHRCSSLAITAWFGLPAGDDYISHVFSCHFMLDEPPRALCTNSISSVGSVTPCLGLTRVNPN
jgi:hypothetical protein